MEEKNRELEGTKRELEEKLKREIQEKEGARSNLKEESERKRAVEKTKREREEKLEREIQEKEGEVEKLEGQLLQRHSTTALFLVMIVGLLLGILCSLVTNTLVHDRDLVIHLLKLLVLEGERTFTRPS